MIHLIALLESTHDEKTPGFGLEHRSGTLDGRVGEPVDDKGLDPVGKISRTLGTATKLGQESSYFFIVLVCVPLGFENLVNIELYLADLSMREFRVGFQLPISISRFDIFSYSRDCAHSRSAGGGRR